MKKFCVLLVAFDTGLLEIAAKRIKVTALRFGAVVRGPVPLPTKETIYTVLNGPHVNSKSKSQWVMYRHRRLLIIENMPQGGTQAHDELMNLDLPLGVEVSLRQG